MSIIINQIASGGGGGGSAATTTYAAKVSASVTQSVAHSTWTSIAMDIEVFDNDAIHDNVTNNTRLTCKTAGRYLVGGMIGFAPNTTGVRFARIKKNGTTNLTSGSILPITGPFASRIVVSTIVDLAVNDYIEMQAFQTSGGALDTEVSADYAPDFYMIQILVNDITIVAEQIRGKNLLHNWDFRNPVNQRGATSYTASGYMIDRWASANAYGTLTINSGYISFAASGGDAYLTQKFENYTTLLGQTATLSVILSNGTALSATGTIPSSTGASIAINYSGNDIAYVYYTSSVPFLEVAIRAADGTTISIAQIKLELGSVSTLANDPPADYGEQLALCQRYFVRTSGWNRIRTANLTANYIDFVMYCPVEMRIIPSIIGTFTVWSFGVSQGAQTGFSFETKSYASAGVLIRATKTSHGLSDGYLYFEPKSALSADL